MVEVFLNKVFNVCILIWVNGNCYYIYIYIFIGICYGYEVICSFSWGNGDVCSRGIGILGIGIRCSVVYIGSYKVY